MSDDWPVTGIDPTPRPDGVEPAEETGTDVRPTGRPNARMRQTVGDMIRSMAVVLVVVFAIVVLAWRPEPEAVKVVEPGPVVAQAVAEAPFAVLAPTGLDERWRPTSARWEPTAESGDDLVLHIGYVTPGDQYAQVVQSADTSAAFLAEQTTQGTPTGTQDVAGVTWQRWDGDPRRSLVLEADESVVIVSGGAAWDELVTLAQSLGPAATSLPSAPPSPTG